MSYIDYDLLGCIDPCFLTSEELKISNAIFAIDAVSWRTGGSRNTREREKKIDFPKCTAQYFG